MCYVLFARSHEKTPVLPPLFLNDIHLHSTQILNAVQNFFTFHLIEPFGLEYSSRGLSFEDLKLKLRQFFQSLTPDGPRYDTYLVYYSGPVDENGDWALTGRNWSFSNNTTQAIKCAISVVDRTLVSGIRNHRLQFKSWNPDKQKSF